MIIGIGSDIVSIKRMRNTLGRFDERVIARLFTPPEQAYANQAKCELGRLGRFAKRFAAKEAFSKALGTGIGSVSWQDIEVDRLNSGAPFLKISAAAATILAGKIPAGYKARLHLSLSDETLYAVAFVIIEAVPAV